MEAKLDPPPGRGPFVYRIHDQIYHSIGNLHPESGDKPSYGQLYILDAGLAASERNSHPANSACKAGLLTELAEIIACKNPYAESFKMMKDIVNEENSNAVINRADPMKVK
jgi:hypothetical protein